MSEINLSELHKKVKAVTRLKTGDKYFYPYMASTGHPIIKRLYEEYKTEQGVYKFSQLTDNQRLYFELGTLNNKTLIKINTMCDRLLADAGAKENEPSPQKQEQPMNEKKTAYPSTEQLSLL